MEPIKKIWQHHLSSLGLKGLTAHSCKVSECQVGVFLETLRGTLRCVELCQHGSRPKTPF